MFQRLAYFTDIHFGRSGNSRTANDDNLAFLAWFVEQAKQRGCETCIFGGDWHDSRHALHLSTLDASIRGMEMLDAAFEQVIWIPGNHDLLYRDKRDISSVEIARHLTRSVMIREPTRIGEVLFLPWLVGDERTDLERLCQKVRYVFGHLEVPGFMMNAKVEMPDAPHATKAEHLSRAELVVTGHFHKRQLKGNVLYAGNVMPFNFADAWDDERGAMFLEWGGEPEFAAWPDQPVFRTATLSEIIGNPERFLIPRASLRATLDMADISFEDAQGLRDTLIAEHGLRRFEIIPPTRSVEMGEIDLPAMSTVDEIVIEGLKSIESAEYDTGELVAIWHALAETSA